MKIMNIRQQLARDEGFRNLPYKDSRGIWTIGIGHKLGDAIPPQFTGGATNDEVTGLFEADLSHVWRLLDVYMPWWKDAGGIDDPRCNVLVNMGFNLGVPGVAQFHTFLAFDKSREWQRAADDLATTLAARQLPERYARLRQQLTTGVWI